MKPVTMAEIALAAIKFKAAIDARRSAQAALTRAYFHWKEVNGFQRVEKNTSEWELMMDATTPQYKALQKAKGVERRSLAKLECVCPVLVGEEVAV